MKNLATVITDTVSKIFNKDALLEILFSISNLGETVAKDHLANGVPTPTSPTGVSTSTNTTASGT